MDNLEYGSLTLVQMLALGGLLNMAVLNMGGLYYSISKGIPN